MLREDDCMNYTPSTTPETTFQLLRRSWQLYCATFLKVFFLSLILSIIAFIPRIIALIAGRDVVANLPLLSPHQLWLLLIYIADLTLFMAILWRLQCVTTNAHEHLFDDVKTGFKKVPLIIAGALAQFLVFILVSITAIGVNLYMVQQNLVSSKDILGILIIGLPAAFQFLFCVYAFYLLYFYFPIILTENEGAIASLIKSAKLVWGRWWKTFWTITIPWIIYVIVLILFVKFGFRMHVYFYNLPTLTISSTILHIIIFAIFIPWFAATSLVTLRDLEISSTVIVVKKPKKNPRKKPSLKPKTKL